MTARTLHAARVHQHSEGVARHVCTSCVCHVCCNRVCCKLVVFVLKQRPLRPPGHRLQAQDAGEFSENCFLGGTAEVWQQIILNHSRNRGCFFAGAGLVGDQCALTVKGIQRTWLMKARFWKKSSSRNSAATSWTLSTARTLSIILVVKDAGVPSSSTTVTPSPCWLLHPLLGCLF